MSVENKSSKTQVSVVIITENEHGQRLDNFLIKTLKGVPKSRIYRALRSGEVRVNKARKKQHYQLQKGDHIRIPPIRVAKAGEPVIPANKWQQLIVTLYEDEHLLIVDKPSGLAVHGGSGLDYGLIEALRYFRSDDTFLELCHRLDRETSGVLILAKSRRALLGMNERFKQHEAVQKSYYALVKGVLDCQQKVVRKALATSSDSSHRHMVLDRQGQEATSIVSTDTVFADATLVNIELVTGRTHQARVHMASLGHPIAGDWQYGDNGFNKSMREGGLNRLFLHAHKVLFTHPICQKSIKIETSLPENLTQFLSNLPKGA